MKNNNEPKSNNKGKYRDKCGDCYYNGKCPILLKDCIFKSKLSITIK